MKIFVILFVFIIIQGCSNNNYTPPDTIYFQKEDFNGVENVIIENYPKEIKLKIENHLEREYDNKIKDIKIVVFYPAVKSKTTIGKKIEEQKIYVDTTQFVARVNVEFLSKGKEHKADWTFCFDKNFKKIYNIKD